MQSLKLVIIYTHPNLAGVVGLMRHNDTPKFCILCK